MADPMIEIASSSLEEEEEGQTTTMLDAYHNDIEISLSREGQTTTVLDDDEREPCESALEDIITQNIAASGSWRPLKDHIDFLTKDMQNFKENMEKQENLKYLISTASKLDRVISDTVSTLAKDYKNLSTDYSAFKVISREISGLADLSLQVNGRIMDLACDEEEKQQILAEAVVGPRQENIKIIESWAGRCTTNDIIKMYEITHSKVEVDLSGAAAEDIEANAQAVGFEMILNCTERLAALGRRR